jgi:hypothetical protein
VVAVGNTPRSELFHGQLSELQSVYGRSFSTQLVSSPLLGQTSLFRWFLFPCCTLSKRGQLVSGLAHYNCPVDRCPVAAAVHQTRAHLSDLVGSQSQLQLQLQFCRLRKLLGVSFSIVVLLSAVSAASSVSAAVFGPERCSVQQRYQPCCCTVLIVAVSSYI